MNENTEEQTVRYVQLVFVLEEELWSDETNEAERDEEQRSAEHDEPRYVNCPLKGTYQGNTVPFPTRPNCGRTGCCWCWPEHLVIRR